MNRIDKKIDYEMWVALGGSLLIYVIVFGIATGIIGLAHFIWSNTLTMFLLGASGIISVPLLIGFWFVVYKAYKAKREMGQSNEKE